MKFFPDYHPLVRPRVIPFTYLPFCAATISRLSDFFYHFIFVPLSAGSFDLLLHRLFQAARMSSNQEHDPNHHHLHNNHHRPPLINLINNPSSHFRRQVWAAWGWNRFGIQRGSTRPTAGIHRSELEILRSCSPHSALSCIFVFVFLYFCILDLYWNLAGSFLCCRNSQILAKDHLILQAWSALPSIFVFV